MGRKIRVTKFESNQSHVYEEGVGGFLTGDCPSCEAARNTHPPRAGNVVFFDEEYLDDYLDDVEGLLRPAGSHVLRRVERMNDGWPAFFFCVKVTADAARAEIAGEIATHKKEQPDD
jgi:hypothetical protein